MKINVVIPLYNEAEAFSGCFEIINNTLKEDGLDPRFVLVDDGSSDETWKVLTDIASTNSNVNAIRFSRNFGKEIALTAGIDACKEEIVVIMDSDLQHPPKYIKPMLDEMNRSGVDIIEGVKSNRGKESLLYKVFARSFYKLLHMMSGVAFDNSSDFKILSKKVVDKIKAFNERNVFFRGIIDYVGFEKVRFPFEVDDRHGGKTSFSFRKLVSLALDAVVSYSSKPLYIVFISAIVFFLFSFVLIIQTLYNYFSGIAVSGFSTVIILILLSASLIMMSLGIIGVYLSRIYDEVKGRPTYVIMERIDEKNN